MDEEERQLAWLAAMQVLVDYGRRAGNPWPLEFCGKTNEGLLEAILQTERETRSGLDAVVRSLARNQAMPGMTELERWHFAHRLEFAKGECQRRFDAGENLPEDEDQILETILIAGWLANVEAWRERMQLLAASM